MVGALKDEAAPEGIAPAAQVRGDVLEKLGEDAEAREDFLARTFAHALRAS
jgi:predicted RNA polymerase sigma factor